MKKPILWSETLPDLSKQAAMQKLQATAKEVKPIANKYRNTKVKIDGFKFDSKAEGRRYFQLKSLKKAGEIDHLTLQPKFPIVVNGKKICTYVADFQYHELANNEIIIEDVKGVKTAVYQLKKKLILALHGIIITEVKA